MNPARVCPVCKRSIHSGDQTAAFHPFCSKRCADVDLGRWLTGNYAIPAVETDDESEGAAGEADVEGTVNKGPDVWPGAKPVRH
jgi:endogenous inhibitor of DNA gyrase (YacG/DUF329 family)